MALVRSRGGVVRIPGDRPLESWIRDLMEHDRLYAFYQSDDWQELRDAVLLDHNYECEMCAAEGKYRRADTVHHEHEVRREPSMALTRFVTTDDGERHEVLHPLCNHHHNVVHKRTYSELRKQRTQSKDERSNLREEIW